MSDREKEEKKRKFLLLFGLPEHYSHDELSSTYRTLAKLNHPDVSGDVSSEMRMAIINEGYRFLREYLRDRPFESKPMERREDPAYNCYREAFQLLKRGFDEYFGESEDRSGVGNLMRLRERLLLAKRGFSRLVNELPYNPWVDDAIDKINSINKWLD